MTTPDMTRSEILDSPAVRMLNLLIDKKAQEMVLYGTMLQTRAGSDRANSQNSGDGVSVRTYDERKGKEDGFGYVVVPVSAHNANDLRDYCDRLIKLDQEINELQRAKLNLVRDCDFNDGGAAQIAVFGRLVDNNWDDQDKPVGA